MGVAPRKVNSYGFDFGLGFFGLGFSWIKAETWVTAKTWD